MGQKAYVKMVTFSFYIRLIDTRRKKSKGKGGIELRMVFLKQVFKTDSLAIYCCFI